MWLYFLSIPVSKVLILTPIAVFDLSLTRISRQLLAKGRPESPDIHRIGAERLLAKACFFYRRLKADGRVRRRRRQHHDVNVGRQHLLVGL